MDCVKRIGLSERELLLKVRRMQQENPLMEVVLVLNKIDQCPDQQKLTMLAQELGRYVPAWAGLCWALAHSLLDCLPPHSIRRQLQAYQLCRSVLCLGHLR